MHAFLCKHVAIVFPKLRGQDLGMFWVSLGHNTLASLQDPLKNDGRVVLGDCAIFDVSASVTQIQLYTIAETIELNEMEVCTAPWVR